MKKALSLINIIAVIGCCTMFTSCHEDADTEISMDISGQWTGNWGMFYEYSWYENGVKYSQIYDSYDTDIIFYPDYDYATHGYGYQVDWYREGPYQRLSYRFDWSVSNGRIYLTYPGYSDYDAYIYNYRLNPDRFTGYFDGAKEPFNLYKMQDYYNWYDYENLYRSYGYFYLEWDWGGYYYDPYYYARTRGTEATDSVGKPSNGRVTKIGNRFTEPKQN